VWQWDDDEERMLVTQEIHTKYDLGRNPTEIKYHDAFGWALTETRSYARGYQLTGFSTSARADITVDTSGSYTYDTNNNMRTTKSLDVNFMTAGSGNVRLVYRAEWTFTFDRKNRLKSFTNEGASNVRTNLWYDGMGRVWQRWNDDSVSGEWAETLMRYVYDGSTLAQEHEFLASGNGMWIYNYVRYDRDYLHKPDGVRQRSYVGPSSYTDEFLFRDMADIASKVTRGSSATVTRAPRMASGERQPENDLAPTTSSFTDISRLGAHGAFTESYGGGTTNPRTQGFDALLQSGPVHQLPALGGMLLGSPPAGSPLPQGPGAGTPGRGDSRFADGIPQGRGTDGELPPLAELKPREARRPFVRRAAGQTRNLQDLIDECGEECINRWSLCVLANLHFDGNVFHNLCCGLALCPLVLPDPSDPEAWHEGLRCHYCVCGNPYYDDVGTAPGIGYACMCEELSHAGGGKLIEQFAAYLLAREKCQANYAPCAGLPQTPIDVDYDCNQLDCFHFPWPSCYNMCVETSAQTCQEARIYCIYWCHDCHTTAAYEQCLGCCWHAEDLCNQWAVSQKECD